MVDDTWLWDESIAVTFCVGFTCRRHLLGTKVLAQRVRVVSSSARLAVQSSGSAWLLLGDDTKYHHVCFHLFFFLLLAIQESNCVSWGFGPAFDEGFFLGFFGR